MLKLDFKNDCCAVLVDRSFSSSRKKAFSLVELLVVIAIIGILVGLTLPAVMQARESARLTQCKNNLKQQGLALLSFHETKRKFPPGYSIPSCTLWSAHILPYIEQGTIYDSIDLDGPWNVEGSPNQKASTVLIPLFRCPSTTSPEKVDPSVYKSFDKNPCTYIACASGIAMRESGDLRPQAGDENLDGTMFVNSKIRLQQIRDGSSNTIVVGEAEAAFHFGPQDDDSRNQIVDHWYIGGVDTLSDEEKGDVSEALGSTGIEMNAFFGNAAHIDEMELCFSSNHFGGCAVVFADGHIQFIADTVDRSVWSALGTRAGGEVAHLPD